MLEFGLCLQRRITLVFTYHTRYEKYAHYVPLTRPLVEAAAVRLSTRFASRADAVVAPSMLVHEHLRRRGVTTPISVVPTGVDLERFRPGDRAAARRALGLGLDDRLLLYVGRLDREKSVDSVLLAFDRIAGTVAPARLWLVGQGKEGEALRRLAERLPTGDRIHFAGVREHARPAPLVPGGRSLRLRLRDGDAGPRAGRGRAPAACPPWP